jgi:hypothetical protein
MVPMAADDDAHVVTISTKSRCQSSNLGKESVYVGIGFKSDCSRRSPDLHKGLTLWMSC